MLTRIVAASLGVLTFLVVFPVRAQLARELDDPSGRGPRRVPTSQTEGETREELLLTPVPSPGYGTAGGVSYGTTEPLESSFQLRIRALESSFQTLGASGPDYTGTVLSMVGGGLTIALAAVLYTQGAPWDTLAPYYFVAGGVGVVRPAIIDFFLRPDARTPAIRFAHMPMRTEAERQERLRFGEHELESLAERSFITRVVDASINIAGALAVIPAFLIPNDWTIDNPIQAFIFLGPAIQLVGAIITLASQSGAEQRWDAYRRMRQGLEDEEEGSAATR